MTTRKPKSSPGRVTLRDVTRDDLPTLFEYQRDPESIRMAAVPSRDAEAFAAHWAKILSDPTVRAMVVELDGRMAGYVVSFVRFGEREVGYWIAREQWGRGIASRALAAFLDVDRARPIYARVAKHNVASLRVVEKCGFEVSADEVGPKDWMGDGIEELLLKLGAPPDSGPSPSRS